MERLMRYKTLQCFLAALIMIAFLAPAAYASGTPDTREYGDHANHTHALKQGQDAGAVPCRPDGVRHEPG